MHRSLIMTLCVAALGALMVSSSAFAEITPPAADAPSPAATPRAHSPKTAARRKPVAATKPARAAPSSEAYQLVPQGKPTSALVRARQNSFEAPDDDSGGSARSSRRIGIGLGGSGGTTPGMQIGF